MHTTIHIHISYVYEKNYQLLRSIRILASNISWHLLEKESTRTTPLQKGALPGGAWLRSRTVSFFLFSGCSIVNQASYGTSIYGTPIEMWSKLITNDTVNIISTSEKWWNVASLGSSLNIFKPISEPAKGKLESLPGFSPWTPPQRKAWWRLRNTWISCWIRWKVR